MSRHLLEGRTVVGSPAFLAPLIAAVLDALLQNPIAALQPAIALIAGYRIRDELADQGKVFIAVAQVEQAAHWCFLETLALTLGSVAVHHAQFGLQVMLALVGGKIVQPVRELPDRQILLAPRLPHLPSEFKNSNVFGPFGQSRFLQRCHALTGGATDEHGQRCTLENVHDHRHLPILVVEGDFPFEGFAQMLKGFEGSQISLPRPIRHLHHEAAHLLESSLSRCAQR
ncbi:hypothetical protein D3C84_782870 [compost metagenome]